MPDDFARTLFMASRPYLILNVLPAGLTRPGAQTIRTHLIELIGPAPRVAEGGVVETDDAQWVGPHVGKTTRQEDMLHALGVGVLVAVGTMVGVLVGVGLALGSVVQSPQQSESTSAEELSHLHCATRWRNPSRQNGPVYHHQLGIAAERTACLEESGWSKKRHAQGAPGRLASSRSGRLNRRLRCTVRCPLQ
jgi:hypothetical protein